MPRFSNKSRRKLETCDDKLQDVFIKVVKDFDCTVLEGFRGEKKQNEAYERGNSKLRFPWGKHNKMPSIAVDVIPYPIDWEDRERMSYFAGYVVGIAKMKGIVLRWGGDWDRDTQLKDNKFDDLVHFEIIEEKKK
jgi:peptidoglycan L-alanyl-D-glutamate endopeptidase CwlK|tara:strand:- start:242 stop:646 length:405 start_codon:yes stop_codon:yes gene_type:complete